MIVISKLLKVERKEDAKIKRNDDNSDNDGESMSEELRFHLSKIQMCSVL